MVRLAGINDAEQLELLNMEFNGEGETTLENIRDSLLNNSREIVIVDEDKGVLTGFVCVQLKRSFCYNDLTPEITEVYVRPAYRQRGVAAAMMAFAEEYVRAHYPVHRIELLTGDENAVAQRVYAKMGYLSDDEMHMSKQISISEEVHI